MKLRLKKKYLNFGLSVFAAASFSLVSPVAFAGTYIKQCQDAVNTAKAHVKANGKKLNEADLANALAALQQADNSMNGNSILSGKANFTQAENATAAGNSAIKELHQCVQQCHKAFDSAQADTQAVEAGEPKKIVDMTESGCFNDLNAEIQALQSAAKGAYQAGLGDQQTTNATNGTPSSNGSNGSGLSSALLPALLGAAAGFGAAKLLDKDKDKKDKDSDDANKSQDAVVCDADNNCAVDCTKDTAWEYSDCNEQEATACASNLSDSTCQDFSGRYCSTDTAEGTTIDGYTKDKNGEGIGTAFCDKVAATNYCATSGRDQCPSCLQLNNSQLAACQANPSLCLAQNTTAQIEQAKTTCPDDPIFANPEYTAGGSATVTDPNAPDPVVTDPNATTATESTTASNSTASSSTSFVTASVKSRQAAGGQASDVASGNGSSGFESGSGGGMGVASVGGRTASGGILPGRVASASASGGISRGPASDVSGQYSSSLFLESSQAIAKRCQQGRLLHCL